MKINSYGEIEGPCPILDLDWAEKINMTQTEMRIFCGLGCSVICPNEFLRKFGKRCTAAGIKVQLDLFGDEELMWL